MPIAALLDAHIKELAPGMTVRRLLPSARRQSIGPYLFFDHFGPLAVKPDSQFDVRPHPHIGLSTVTYLFDGAMLHRDSLGSVQLIEPGAINWMTAGRGIVHSERAPDALRGTSYVNHGLQLWAGLPQAFEEVEPAFVHAPAAAIPQRHLPGGSVVRVLIGDAFDARSPVASYSRTLYLDVQAPAGTALELPPSPDERAVYGIDAALAIDGSALAPHTIALLAPDQPARIATGASAARYVILGGEPLDGPRVIHWNFVSSRRERIDQARRDWIDRRFDPIPGETEFIPYPARSG